MVTSNRTAEEWLAMMADPLLAGVIGECAAWAGRDASRGPGYDTATWAAACELTGTTALH